MPDHDIVQRTEGNEWGSVRCRCDRVFAGHHVIEAEQKHAAHWEIEAGKATEAEVGGLAAAREPLNKVKGE